MVWLNIGCANAKEVVVGSISVVQCKYKEGETAPPFHVNCRSTTIPYFDDEFTKDEKRASRDENDEGYILISANIKYPEWKEKFIQPPEAKSVILPTDEMNADGKIPKDIQSEIEKVIDEFKTQYDVRIDQIKYDVGDKDDAPFQFQPVKDGFWYKSQLTINKNFAWDNNLAEFNKRIYNNYENGFNASKNIRDLLRHEMAHFMTFQDCENWAQYVRKEQEIREMWVDGLSRYNSIKKDGAETIAEGFVAISNNEIVSKEIKKLVENYVLRYKK